MSVLEADILIDGCSIVTMNKRGLIEDGVIAIKDDRIIYVGKRKNLKVKTEKILYGKGKVALPGLVNCHTHVAMTLFRGVAEDKPLNEWLKNTIWPLEIKLTREDVYKGALLGCLEMIKTGTTCFSDMYFYEDAVADACIKSGLRGVLAAGIIDIGFEGVGKRLMKEAIEIIKRYNGAEGRVNVRFGPHATHTCTKETLMQIREKADEFKVGVHMHVEESREEVDFIKKQFGLTPFEYLNEIGFLKSDVLVAHCTYISKYEIEILAKKNVSVSHNPIANAKLGMGIAPAWEMMERGVNIGLGTDGPACNNTFDMFETMKFAALIQKARLKNAKIMPMKKVLEMATVNGAKALQLEDRIGSIEVGKKADIILVNLGGVHLRPNHDIYANLIYAVKGFDVDTTIVNGRILMENKEVKILDEDKVIEEAEKSAYRLVEKI